MLSETLLGTESPPLVLALSGGGFRATFFHLGVIKYLHDSDQLRRVSHITSVSGGSVLAAHLVLNWDRYLGGESEFQKAANELVQLARLDLRGRIGRRLIAGFGLRQSTKLLQRYYDRVLFHGKTLADWQSTELLKKPQLFVLATNLTRGTPTAFSSEGILIDARNPSKILHSSMVPISLAVAASSAYPALFSPVRLSAEQLGLAQEQFVPSVQYLTDGGVFDNSGTAVLAKIIEGKVIERFFLSDASRTLDWDDRHYALIGGLIRTYEVTMNEAATHQNLRLENDVKCPIGRAKITQELPFQVAKWPEVDQRLVAFMRTDFDYFSDVEIGSLIRHGYTVASITFSTNTAASSRGGFRTSLPEKGEFWVEGQRRHKVLSAAGHVRLRLFSLRDPVLLGPAIVVAIVLIMATATMLMSLHEQWLLHRGQNLTLAQVSELISGPGQDREKLLFRRGVMNNVLSMSFEPMPIMGSIDATKSVALNEHTTAFVQGSTKLIKLQRFDLPIGAQQVRAQSRQTAGATGDIATVWTWFERPDGSFELLARPHSDEAWRVDGRRYKCFYVLSLYDTGLFTQPGEFSGAEIDDLAGTIHHVRFIVGGAVKNLAFGDVFHFPSASPLKFFQRSREEISDLSDPAAIFYATFQNLINDPVRLSHDQDRISEALAVWDEFAAKNTGTWAGFEMKDVHYDFIVRLDGKR